MVCISPLFIRLQKFFRIFYRLGRGQFSEVQQLLHGEPKNTWTNLRYSECEKKRENIYEYFLTGRFIIFDSPSPNIQSLIFEKRYPHLMGVHPDHSFIVSILSQISIIPHIFEQS